MKESKLKAIFEILILSLILFLVTPGLSFGLGRAWDNYLWVPNLEDHTVSKIDVDTHEVVASIPVGTKPAGIAVGFRYVYVPCSLPASLYRIAKDTDEVYDIIDLSGVIGLAIGVAVDRKGYAFVVGREHYEIPATDQAYLLKIDPIGNIDSSTVLVDIDAGVPTGVWAMKSIGIGLNNKGDGFIPWYRAWTGYTGQILFNTSDLSFESFPIDHHYYRGPGVGIDGAGNGWTAGHRAGSPGTASITKMVPDEGLTQYYIPQEWADWQNTWGGVLVDLKQNIWANSGMGLLRLVPETEKLDLFEVGPVEGGLTCDRNGYIWISFPETDQLKKFNLGGIQVGSTADVGELPLGYGDMTGYECTYIPGDVDGDAQVDSADFDYLVQFVLSSGPSPVPLQAGDVDCDGEVDRDDVTYIENYIFQGGPPPCDPDSLIYWDFDGDGYEDTFFGGEDCDDSDASVYPGAEEICDGKDSDCDDTLPADEVDGDGDGSPFCEDCDDTDETAYPGAPEFCDGKDTDCDGIGPAEEVDDDDDGWMICDGDCDDTDPDVSPDAVEGAIDDPTCSDGIDNDCDGLTDTDPECIAILVPDEQATIQGAINEAESGNTILVAPGIYRENIDFIGKDIKVHGVDGPIKTIIDGDRAGSAVAFTSGETEDALLDGFTLRNGSGTFIILAPFIGFGSYVGGGIYLENSSPTITNCMITNNYAYLGGGLYLRDSSPTIENSMIVRNRATGLAHGGGGIYLEDSSPTIIHCTVSSNFAGQYGGAIFCDNASPRITNSILWGNSAIYGSEIHVYSGSPVVTYSDVEGGWSGEGNIEANPSFAGAITFHLGPVSPCVDSGTDAGVYTDMDGQRRPWGAGFDMGADEFSAEPCSVIASSGNQFLALYLIPVLALVFFGRRNLLKRRFLRN